MDVAIDASVLVALLNPNDLWHNQAIDLRNALGRSGATPVYFDCVAGEAVSTATRRLRDKKRMDEITPLLNRPERQIAPETLPGYCRAYRNSILRFYNLFVHL